MLEQVRSSLLAQGRYCSVAIEPQVILSAAQVCRANWIKLYPLIHCVDCYHPLVASLK